MPRCCRYGCKSGSESRTAREGVKELLSRARIEGVACVDGDYDKIEMAGVSIDEHSSVLNDCDEPCADAVRYLEVVEVFACVVHR